MRLYRFINVTSNEKTYQSSLIKLLQRKTFLSIKKLKALTMAMVSIELRNLMHCLN